MDTHETYFKHFLQSLQERGRSPNTLLAYQQDWQQFSAWYQRVNQEKLQLDRLSSLDVQDYLQWSKQQSFKPGSQAKSGRNV